MKLRRENVKRINFRQMPRKNTNVRLLEMAKTIHGLRMEFSKMIETLKMTQAEIKMEFKSSIVQLSSTKKTKPARRWWCMPLRRKKQADLC